MGVDPAVLGRALAARLAAIAAAAARYDAFAFTERPAPDPAADAAGDPALVVRDLALAALRAAGDPLSYALLRRMAGGDAPLADLCVETGLPRLAVWERLNGLVAAGLVGRRHEDDSAGLTPAGAALVELVEGAVAAASDDAPK
ncbi:MAG: hypothetical protein QOD57_2644 [Actinomycetota bacterium]|nr:hypothetical protein [Actinomycetota bacterium]